MPLNPPPIAPRLIPAEIFRDSDDPADAVVFVDGAFALYALALLARLGSIGAEDTDEFDFRLEVVVDDEDKTVRMSTLTRFDVFSMRASSSSQSRMLPASTAGADGVAVGLPEEVDGRFIEAPDEAGLFDFAAH